MGFTCLSTACADYCFDQARACNGDPRFNCYETTGFQCNGGAFGFWYNALGPTMTPIMRSLRFRYTEYIENTDIYDRVDNFIRSDGTKDFIAITIAPLFGLSPRQLGVIATMYQARMLLFLERQGADTLADRFHEICESVACVTITEKPQYQIVLDSIGSGAAYFSGACTLLGLVYLGLHFCAGSPQQPVFDYEEESF